MICQCSGAGGREIFVGQRRTQSHQGALAENAGPRGFKNMGVDIRADDLDIVGVHLGQFSKSQIAIE